MYSGMMEERAHLVGRDVGERQPRYPAAFSLRDEPKQQPPGVAIRADRVD